MKNINHEKLLRGEYEAQAFPADFSAESPVPDYAFNLINFQNSLYRPFVDEFHIKKGMPKLKWPGGKPFAVCLSHDVDAVSLASLAQAIRKRYLRWKTAGDLNERFLLSLGIGEDLLRALHHAGKPDPLFCLERWLAIERNIDAHSTFFFWPGWEAVSKRHTSDCTYRLSDQIVFEGQACSVAEAIREMSRRGWEIGLHASWYSFNDADELRRQKDALENAVQQEVVSIRQHYLHYDIRITPKIQAQAGFKYDSTLGFNDNVGFRFGTCIPWSLWEMESEKELSIVEVPLIVQDTALLDNTKGMRLDEDTAFRYIQHLAEQVEAVGGVITLSWHPEYIVRPMWWRLYARSLQFFKKRNAYMGGMKEIMTILKRPSATENCPT